jgi:dihydroorotase
MKGWYIMKLLIKHARIVDSSGCFQGDVYIENGTISRIGENLEENCEVIDADGLTLMPSLIDLHVHFRDPGFTYKEDIESGCRAAVKGGYTMVNLMANTNPPCSSMKIVDYVLKKVKKVGLIDAHQCVTITNNFDGEDISHLDKLDEKVKIISEDGKDVMNGKIMLKAMIKAKKLGKIVMCHSEEHSLSDIDMRLAENMMTWRNIEFSDYTGCPVHIAHVSTRESMEYIIKAKSRGVNVTCEVTPHHIILSGDNYRVNPPIRDKGDVDYLVNSIKRGWVDAISTDHAPHTREDKNKGAAGISGIETAFSLCYTKLVKEGHITLNRLSELMSKNPAEILQVKKGLVAPGYDGDLILVDLDDSYTIHGSEFESRGKNTAFEGFKVFGRVLKTIKAGKIVFERKN